MTVWQTADKGKGGFQLAAGLGVLALSPQGLPPNNGRLGFTLCLLRCSPSPRESVWA